MNEWSTTTQTIKVDFDEIPLDSKPAKTPRFFSGPARTESQKVDRSKIKAARRQGRKDRKR